MRKNLTLNRPIFTQQVFRSTALTVLTSLFQRLPDAGNYDLIVRRDGVVVAHTSICAQESGCGSQTNIDLAKIDPPEGGYKVDAGGMIGFFVSEGGGSYTVRITQVGEQEKRVILDNAESISEGAVFAVTLLRPGDYIMRTLNGRSRGKINLRLPDDNDRKKGYRPSEAAMIEVDGKGNFKPNEAKLLTGQSLVFVCNAPVQLEVAFSGEREEKPRVPRPPKLTYGRRPTTSTPSKQGKSDKRGK